MQVIKEVLSVLSGFLTPVIAIITTYIAIGQYKNSVNKTKLDLYEKRYKVYYSLVKFISINVSGDIFSEDVINQYHVNTNECVFLFDKDINEYIKYLLNKACERNIVTVELNDKNLPIGEKRSGLYDREVELISWFEDQYEVVNKKFMKYLRI